MSKNNYNDDESFNDDARFTLSEAYIMYLAISDVFDVGDWKPELWEFMYEYLMKKLENAGYISKVSEGEDKDD